MIYTPHVSAQEWEKLLQAGRDSTRALPLARPALLAQFADAVNVQNSLFYGCESWFMEHLSPPEWHKAAMEALIHLEGRKQQIASLLCHDAAFYHGLRYQPAQPYASDITAAHRRTILPELVMMIDRLCLGADFIPNTAHHFPVIDIPQCAWRASTATLGMDSVVANLAEYRARWRTAIHTGWKSACHLGTDSLDGHIMAFEVAETLSATALTQLQSGAAKGLKAFWLENTMQLFGARHAHAIALMGTPDGRFLIHQLPAAKRDAILVAGEGRPDRDTLKICLNIWRGMILIPGQNPTPPIP